MQLITKKQRILIIFAIIFIIGCVILPDIIYQNIPKVDAVSTEVKKITVSKNTVGKVFSTGEHNIILSDSCVIKKVHIKQGDYILKNDVLADVDIEKTFNYCISNGIEINADEIEKTILSDVEGYVSSVYFINGSIAEESAILCTVIPTKSLKITSNMSEDDIIDIKEGQKISFTGNAFNGTFRGVVESVGAAAEIGADGVGRVAVIFSIDNPDSKLKIGYSAKVKIETDTINNAICVPESAVSSENGKEYLYVCEDSVLKKRRITTLMYKDGYAIIENGLSSNECVAKNSDKILGDELKAVINYE